MIKSILSFLLILLSLLQSLSLASADITADMLKNPPRYIEVTDWGFYVAARVAILHHVTIENKSDVTYKDIKIRVNYYSTNPTNYGNKISQQESVLKITLPPRSKNVYLKGGKPIGAGSNQMMAKNLEVLTAVAEKH